VKGLIQYHKYAWTRIVLETSELPTGVFQLSASALAKRPPNDVRVSVLLQFLIECLVFDVRPDFLHLTNHSPSRRLDLVIRKSFFSRTCIDSLEWVTAENAVLFKQLFSETLLIDMTHNDKHHRAAAK
jgi:hypothetical protein